MPFNAREFVNSLGRRLVHEFDEASQAGTPGLIGSSREHPARRELSRVLPGYTDVGSGIVCDLNGDVSKQQDIIVFEKFNCPTFSINGTPEATYFPVEGVVAAGEVKSTLSLNTLRDSFKKIESAKKLRRVAQATVDIEGLPPTVSYRTYGTINSFAATTEDQFNQETNWKDQVYGFILCQKFEAQSETTLANAKQLYDEIGPRYSPNLIVSLQDGFIEPASSNPPALHLSPMDADSLIYCNESASAFAHLVARLMFIATHGRTVSSAHFRKYLDVSRHNVSQLIELAIRNNL